MDFVSPFDLCDRVNCSLDYEVDSLTFLKPDTDLWQKNFYFCK